MSDECEGRYGGVIVRGMLFRSVQNPHVEAYTVDSIILKDELLIVKFHVDSSYYSKSDDDFRRIMRAVIDDAPAQQNAAANPTNQAQMAQRTNQQQESYDAAMLRLRAHEKECQGRAAVPVVPRGKDADCTAHGCDRIRELGVYANRAGLCTMHVAEFTGESGGSVHAFDSQHWGDVNWADGIRRQMRARPEPQLVVGGLWRTRPDGMR